METNTTPTSNFNLYNTNPYHNPNYIALKNQIVDNWDPNFAPQNQITQNCDPNFATQNQMTYNWDPRYIAMKNQIVSYDYTPHQQLPPVPLLLLYLLIITRIKNVFGQFDNPFFLKISFPSFANRARTIR